MPGLVVVAAILFGWALLAGRVERWSITAPIAMAVAGALLTAGSSPVVRYRLDTGQTEAAIELLMAILLFVDATHGPGGLLGPEPRLTLRLVLVALPLSMVAAVGAGYLVLPGHGFWLLAVLATVVVPIDLAPASALLRERRIPRRLRDLLNVESGLNDGVVAPAFFLCLAAAPTNGSTIVPVDGFVEAIAAIFIALCIGTLAGWGGGRALTWAWTHGWTQPVPLRVGAAAIPVVVYALSDVLHGNGFVAAFLAGAFFIPAARRLPEDALLLIEDLGSLLSLLLWFVFGGLITSALSGPLSIRIVLFAVLALTIARIVPVGVALIRTDVPLYDRAFLAWVGPRGLATIVFGLLAYLELTPGDADLVADAMVTTVALGVLAHGLTLVPLARSYAGRAAKAPQLPPERS